MIRNLGQDFGGYHRRTIHENEVQKVVYSSRPIESRGLAYTLCQAEVNAHILKLASCLGISLAGEA